MKICAPDFQSKLLAFPLTHGGWADLSHHLQSGPSTPSPRPPAPPQLYKARGLKPNVKLQLSKSETQVTGDGLALGLWEELESLLAG